MGSLPLATRVHLLRQIESAGLAGLLAAALALLDDQSGRLLELTDEDDLLEALRTITSHASDAATLLEQTGAWLPAAVLAVALPATSESVPALQRHGSRVLDHDGREVLHAGRA